ncbi:MAG: hypothetical protein ACOZNI_10015, partial [Myxococcota bacterium]
RVDERGRIWLVGFGRAGEASPRDDVAALVRAWEEACPGAPDPVAATFSRMRAARDAGAALACLPADDPRGAVLDADALRGRFEGPDRVFHVPEDAARILYSRSAGLPGRVESELDLWLRTGLARRGAVGVVMDRAALNRLAAEPWAAATAWRAASGDLGSATRTALGEAERLERAGSLSNACHAAISGLLAATAAGDPDLVQRLAERLVSASIAVADLRALRDARDRIARIPGREARDLAELLRGVEARDGGRPDEARGVWARLGPFRDLALECSRQSLRAMAAIHHGKRPEMAEAELEALDAWAREDGSPRALAMVEGWRGLWCYRRERFSEAAARHLAAAEGREDVAGRLAARTNAASAALEVDVALARALADGAEAEAARARIPFLEARAAWISRCARYRAGEALAPDPELEAAALSLDAPLVCGPFFLVEAAARWRAGARREAAVHARRARDHFRRQGMDHGELVAASLLAAVDPEFAAAEGDVLVGRARACAKPWAALQALALLAVATGRADLAPDAERLVAAMEPSDLARRRDVLALDEALHLCRTAVPAPSVG